MFSKKATKIDEIFTVHLKLCSKCQIDGEDFVNFCGLLRKHELYPRIWNSTTNIAIMKGSKWSDLAWTDEKLQFLTWKISWGFAILVWISSRMVPMTSTLIPKLQLGFWSPVKMKWLFQLLLWLIGQVCFWFFTYLQKEWNNFFSCLDFLVEK